MTLRQDQQQPLTRRQLREAERAAAAAAAAQAQQVPPVQLPFTGTSVDEVPATFRGPETQTEQPASAAPTIPAPADVRPVLSEQKSDEQTAGGAPSSEQPTGSPAAAPVQPLTRRQLRALLQAQQSANSGSAQAPAPIAQAPVEQRAPETSVPTPPVIAEAPAPEPTPPTVASPPVIDEAPVQPTTGEIRAYQPPAGHWSLGNTDDFDELVAPDTTGGSSTSSALIMPVVPSAADMTGPLNATGEILLTGSIDLPRSLGSTGQIQGRFDGVELDRMIDQHEGDAPDSSSVEPVAATRAISTHAPASSVITPPKQTGHRVGAIVGSVAGGVAALAAAGLLVAGFVFHAF
ncbi:hypothetical protein [Gryllotalpicola ginsengisoli]|uniref:hypothetical protein n=1 Tax=Gryllotalpicola ginsengisoli TaxID=444608 RepID=UPI0003B455FE|nr:hypothetical protein [Gryllotalpicola ginsengisoli]